MKICCLMQKQSAILSLILLAALAQPSGAGTITAFSQTRTVTGTFLSVPDDRIYGWLFQTNAPILVTQLGYFDESLDGLQNTHDIGIWNATGTQLLTSTTVPTGAGGTVDGTYRYFATVPVLLAANQQYVIGSTIRGTGDDPILPYPQALNLQFDSAVTFLFGKAEVNATGLGLRFPSNFTSLSNTHLDMNFKGVTQSTVPEPSSWGILLVCGIVVCRRCRRLRNVPG